MDYLHPLVVYALFGVLLGLVVASAVTRLRPSFPPAAKIWLWSAPLAVPFIAYGVSCALRRPGECLAWAASGPGVVGAAAGWLCRAGTILAYGLTPFFGAALALGTAKALSALWLGERLVRSSRRGPAEKRAAEALAAVAGSMGLRPPALAVVPDAGGQAFALGFRRPVVVFSERLILSLDEEELAAAMAHELAHIAAGDHWRKWLGVLLRDALFFTGLSFPVFRRLDAEAEAMADARAARVTGSPLALAAALIKGWRLGSGRGLGQLALDNFVPLLARSDVEVRVNRLLEDSPAASSREAGWPWTVATAWVAIGLAVTACC